MYLKFHGWSLYYVGFSWVTTVYKNVFVHKNYIKYDIIGFSIARTAKKSQKITMFTTHQPHFISHTQQNSYLNCTPLKWDESSSLSSEWVPDTKDASSGGGGNCCAGGGGKQSSQFMVALYLTKSSFFFKGIGTSPSHLSHFTINFSSLMIHWWESFFISEFLNFF